MRIETVRSADFSFGGRFLLISIMSRMAGSWCVLADTFAMIAGLRCAHVPLAVRAGAFWPRGYLRVDAIAATG